MFVSCLCDRFRIARFRRVIKSPLCLSTNFVSSSIWMKLIGEIMDGVGRSGMTREKVINGQVCLLWVAPLQAETNVKQILFITL